MKMYPLKKGAGNVLAILKGGTTSFRVVLTILEGGTLHPLKGECKKFYPVLRDRGHTQST